MTNKIDKKELTEPDKFQILFMSARTFILKHRIRIYTAAGIAVLIMAIAGGWHVYRLNYEKRAEQAYAKVLDAAQKAGSPTGDTAAIQGYKDVIQKFPRSRAASIAYYRLGSLYLGRNEIEPAIQAYQDSLKKSDKESDLVTLTYHGLGVCFEIKKDFKMALESFENASNTKTASSFEALNYSGMARVYEAMNSPAKAAEYFRKALVKTKDPVMTIYLKRKIANLG
jgi:tetratricopeptide (TPR) repeat protein